MVAVVVASKEFQTPEENFLQKWKLKVRKKLIWTSRKDTKWRSILGGGGGGGISEVSWRSFCQSDVYENSQYFLTWQECDCVIYTHSEAKIWNKCKFCTVCHKLWLKNRILIELKKFLFPFLALLWGYTGVGRCL